MEDDEHSIDGRREHDYDISRLMAFSDGVFAVAITLLVFTVPVPAIAQNVPCHGCPPLFSRQPRPS